MMKTNQQELIGKLCMYMVIVQHTFIALELNIFIAFKYATRNVRILLYWIY